jgi:S1-C subfamily serine protease
VEHWDEHPPRRLSAAPLAACVLAVLAALVALFAWQASRAAVSDRAQLQRQVDALQQTVTKLSGHDASLASRVGTTEAALRKREAGIAPLARRTLRSVFTVRTNYGLGTGFVAWNDADSSYLLTAAHVVADEPSGTVTITRRGGSWSGEVSGIDLKNDLAIVRVNGRPAGAAPLWQNPRTHRAQQGDQLLLIGSPFGLGGTVTTGVVSRVTKREIQTDAAANPGNSGGPALDAKGNIVGVLVSGGGENINFAIRVERACAKLRDC